MNTRTETATPEFLYNAFEGFYSYCAVKAAFDNRIYEHLGKPATPGEVAAALEKDESMVLKLLECLQVLGLVEKKGDAFCNSRTAEIYCREKSPSNQRILFDQTHATMAKVIFEQASSLSPAASRGWELDEEELIMNCEAGIAFALPDTVRRTVDIIAGLDCFDTASSFLDAGAGPGMFSMEVARRKSDLEVVLLDFPDVLRQTRKIAKRHGMEERLKFVEGNMLEDGIKGEFDIILASDCIPVARRDLVDFLASLREKLAPGGVLVLRHNEIPEPPEESKTNVLLDLGAALAGYGDYMFRPGELPESLSKAGFTSIESIPMKHMTHHYVIHAAKK